MSVVFTPSEMFFLSPGMAQLAVLIAFLVGLGVGPVLAMCVNRLCEQPPQRPERLVTTLVTAALFAISVLMIVGFEWQRTPEVLPDPFWRYGRLLSHLILVGFLIVATATDLREYVIPDQITYTGTALAVVLATASGDVQLIHIWVDWNQPFAAQVGAEIPAWIQQHPHWHGLVWSLAGAAVGAGLTWLARGISSLVLGQEAMGLGDVTLMGMIGGFLGWQPVLFVFLLAPFCGIVVGLVAKTMHNRSHVPYGPYLSLAALFVMLDWKWIWMWEPTRSVSIRRLFGDVPSLAILAGVAFVSLLVLLGIVRWWRGAGIMPPE